MGAGAVVQRRGSLISPTLLAQHAEARGRAGPGALLQGAVQGIQLAGHIKRGQQQRRLIDLKEKELQMIGDQTDVRLNEMNRKNKSAEGHRKVMIEMVPQMNDGLNNTEMKAWIDRVQSIATEFGSAEAMGLGNDLLQRWSGIKVRDPRDGSETTKGILYNEWRTQARDFPGAEITELERFVEGELARPGAAPVPGPTSAGQAPGTAPPSPAAAGRVPGIQGTTPPTGNVDTVGIDLGTVRPEQLTQKEIAVNRAETEGAANFAREGAALGDPTLFPKLKTSQINAAIDQNGLASVESKFGIKRLDSENKHFDQQEKVADWTRKIQLGTLKGQDAELKRQVIVRGLQDTRLQISDDLVHVSQQISARAIRDVRSDLPFSTPAELKPTIGEKARAKMRDVKKNTAPAFRFEERIVPWARGEGATVNQMVFFENEETKKWRQVADWAERGLEPTQPAAAEMVRGLEADLADFARGGEDGIRNLKEWSIVHTSTEDLATRKETSDAERLLGKSGFLKKRMAEVDRQLGLLAPVGTGRQRAPFGGRRNFKDRQSFLNAAIQEAASRGITIGGQPIGGGGSATGETTFVGGP